MRIICTEPSQAMIMASGKCRYAASRPNLITLITMQRLCHDRSTTLQSVRRLASSVYTGEGRSIRRGSSRYSLIRTKL